MKLEKHSLPYSKTAYFSKLIVDYLSGSKKIGPFYKHKPTIASFKKAIADKSKENINRTLLVKVLEEQYAGIELQNPVGVNPIGVKPVAVNINRLKDKNTYTVCTGHQLCLFTGPLYFIYKIITTINLSETLKKNYPKQHFVPVYWMASEDHDFAEVNHINIFGKKISWHPVAEESQNAQGAVGRLDTASLKPVINELQKALGNSSHAKELIALFSKAYLQHKNLSDATRFIVNELFGQYGLVILDADDARLKAEFSKEIIEDAINNLNFTTVNKTIKEFDKLKLKVQVNPRRINSFYLKDNIRERIEKQGDFYTVLGTTTRFTEAELKEEIKNHPERFSPNVTMRPMYQEKILPNLAYIGGGGELAYWLQYKKMFEANKIAFPVLVLRNSVLWIDLRSSKKIAKLKLSAAKLFLKEELLVDDFMKTKFSKSHNLLPEQTSLKKLYAVIAKKAGKIDPTLKHSAEAAMQRGIHSLERIEEKMLRAEKRKQETALNQIRALKSDLFPDGELQERFETLSTFYLSYGKDFIAQLKKELKPLEFNFLLLKEKP